MSWDFGMVIDAGGKERVSVFDGLNYTYNVSSMYYDAFGEKGIRHLDGMTGADCAPLLQAAIEKMESDPGRYRLMNPTNGWGDYEGALSLLRQLLVWCRSAPKATLKVW